ncbi:hypothetical protein Ae201684P_004717 [Aphanomyces euteiches]|nr:hypothetical protein Ae201684P_004717 [Aphanomyces euteiches]
MSIARVVPPSGRFAECHCRMSRFPLGRVQGVQGTTFDSVRGEPLDDIDVAIRNGLVHPSERMSVANGRQECFSMDNDKLYLNS